MVVYFFFLVHNKNILSVFFKFILIGLQNIYVFYTTCNALYIYKFSGKFRKIYSPFPNILNFICSKNYIFRFCIYLGSILLLRYINSNKRSIILFESSVKIIVVSEVRDLHSDTISHAHWEII